MATLIRSVKRVGDTSGFSRRKLSQNREYEAVNIEVLKGILSYLKYLHIESEISDEAYKVLSSHTLSTFIENTINLKVERIFDAIDMTLEKASEVLLTDILA